MHFRKTQEILDNTTLDVVGAIPQTVLNYDGSEKCLDIICFNNPNTNCSYGYLSPRKYYHFLDIDNNGTHQTLRTAISPSYRYQESNIVPYSRVLDVVSDLKQGKYLSEQYASRVLTPDKIEETRSIAMYTFKEISATVLDDAIFIQKNIEIKTLDDLDLTITSEMDWLERVTNIVRRILGC